MSELRQDLEKAAGALTGLAKETSYLVIGAGVLGLNRAQVRRRELQGAGRREEVAKRVKEFDLTVSQVLKSVDAALEPVLHRLPEPLQAAVSQARQARDELRTRVFGGSA